MLLHLGRLGDQTAILQQTSQTNNTPNGIPNTKCLVSKPVQLIFWVSQYQQVDGRHAWQIRHSPVHDTVGAFRDSVQLLVLIDAAAGGQHADVAGGGTRLRVANRARAGGFVRVRRQCLLLCGRFVVCSRLTTPDDSCQ